jgi:RNA 2',3'-cyclic 3'-phosphodiesterase
MGLVRAFIACKLSVSLQESIQNAIAGLRQSLDMNLVRWVPGHNVHLTVKFLGDVAESSLDSIYSAIASQAALHSPFEAVVEGFGAFPNRRRPRVLWIGMTAPPELTSLHHDLDVATERLGYKSDFPDFAPHLTIGRVRQSASSSDQQSIRDALSRMPVGTVGSQHVDAVHLLKSDLKPSGSVYSELYSAPLAKS